MMGSVIGGCKSAFYRAGCMVVLEMILSLYPTCRRDTVAFTLGYFCGDPTVVGARTVEAMIASSMQAGSEHI
jgi:hypothetical protein